MADGLTYEDVVKQHKHIFYGCFAIWKLEEEDEGNTMDDHSSCSLNSGDFSCYSSGGTMDSWDAGNKYAHRRSERDKSDVLESEYTSPSSDSQISTYD